MVHTHISTHSARFSHHGRKSSRQRTKHIEVHYHFNWERIQAGDVDLQHINTNLQVVDIFTKAFEVDNLRQFITDLGLTLFAFPSLRGIATTD